MRITVEIDANTLESIQRLTGEAKKAPAVQKAVENFPLVPKLHLGTSKTCAKLHFASADREVGTRRNRKLCLPRGEKREQGNEQ